MKETPQLKQSSWQDAAPNMHSQPSQPEILQLLLVLDHQPLCDFHLVGSNHDMYSDLRVHQLSYTAPELPKSFGRTAVLKRCCYLNSVDIRNLVLATRHAVGNIHEDSIDTRHVDRRRTPIERSGRRFAFGCKRIECSVNFTRCGLQPHFAGPAEEAHRIASSGQASVCDGLVPPARGTSRRGRRAEGSMQFGGLGTV